MASASNLSMVSSDRDEGRVRDPSMPEVTSQAGAIALIEKIELWRELAFGHKDLVTSVAPPVAKPESRTFELLHRLYEIYRGHSSGAIPEHVWARCLSVLSTLLSTVHFRAQWDAAKAEFPEDFRALVHGIRA